MCFVIWLASFGAVIDSWNTSYWPVNFERLAQVVCMTVCMMPLILFSCSIRSVRRRASRE